MILTTNPLLMGHYSDSLRLHEKRHGKIEVKGKVRVKNGRDLSLTYTPGMAEPYRQIRGFGPDNIGVAASLPVMKGKALLFKEFGGVDAYPICLDKKDSDEIVKIAKAIASYMPHPTFDQILPSTLDKKVAKRVAKAVAKLV